MTPEVPSRSIALRATEPLVAVFEEQDGQEIVRYFAEGEAEVPATDDVIRAALAAIGVCSDLDWEQWSEELDRIRHES